MPKLSQLSPMAANLRGEFPAQFYPTVKMKGHWKQLAYGAWILQCYVVWGKTAQAAGQREKADIILLRKLGLSPGTTLFLLKRKRDREGRTSATGT